MKSSGALVVSLLMSGAVLAQSGGAPTQTGPVAARLGEEHRHRIVAYVDGDNLELVCVQGDEHTARQALTMLQRDIATGRAGAPATGTSRVTVNATLALDNDRLAGADANDRMLLYTPKPVQLGSSFSHFDPRATPNLLMEPNINSDLKVGDTDLADDFMRDLGWRGGRFQHDIRIGDAPGEGFNDPVLGPARMQALRYVMNRWRRRVGSNIPVAVQASFREFDCDAAGAVLAAAGPQFVFREIPNAPPGIWYTGAMAESIANQDLSGSAEADVLIFFNSAIDEGCLGAGTRYHYGRDPAPPGTLSFITVGMHEVTHGLGMTGLVDLESGQMFQGFPDVMMLATFDNKRDKFWVDLSNGGRRRSARSEGDVVVLAPRTTKRARKLLDGSGVIEINAPGNLADTHLVGTANFGPPLRRAGLTADVVDANDGSGDRQDACEPLVNASEMAGNIALVDRGDCTFVEKALNVQAAGAVAMIVANNVNDGVITMGGDDDAVEITSVMITKRLGRQIRRQLGK